MILLGVAAACQVEAGVPWGKVIQKGLEILGTGIVIGAVDAAVDNDNGNQLVPYVPPPPPRFPHPHQNESDLRIILVISGSIIVGLGMLGIIAKCIVKVWVNKGKVKEIGQGGENIEMV